MIDTQKDLESVCDRAKSASAIAIDTEFVWNRTYYPRLGVIQLGINENDCHLIDAGAIVDLSALGKLISDPDIEKILHDAQQDLAIIHRATGAFPRNIFDTRCAAGIAGIGSTCSLASLIEEILGLTLDKSETRTDWLKRPLTDKQIRYAIEDISYLHAIREKLIKRIAEMGRSDWLTEELSNYDEPSLYKERDPRLQYERVKGVGRSAPRERAIIRELASWREEEARRRDRPRNYILADEVILKLARLAPKMAEDIKTVRGVGRRDIVQIQNQIQSGVDVPDADCPRKKRHKRRIDDDTFDDLLHQSMDVLRIQCELHGLDAPFVASRAAIRSLLYSYIEGIDEQLPIMQGWRKNIAGKHIIDLLHKAKIKPF
ncbi:MAG: ribonuclease D [Candidatus Latescibacterota bacterium]|nr:ribonuclease D [Candidatus Latescibacterota bacterium]